MTSALPAYARGTDQFASRDFFRSVPLWPRNAAIGVMTAYRAVISPIYGDVCKYYPSCSAYAVGALQQHGLLKGAAKAAARISRCHPWARGGEDDVPPHPHFRHGLTPRGFVVPSGKD